MYRTLLVKYRGDMEIQLMNVAVMFIDIRNFTSFAAGRDPEEIIRFQNDFLKMVINIVDQYRGHVHQFLGDGCMITFGAPLVAENPSRNAVLASLSLLRTLEKAAGRGDLAATRIGIGIHAGEVATCNIGTSEHHQYSVTGNAVILAARIEQMNKQFGSQMLVTREVVRQAGVEERARLLGEFPVKGWGEPVALFRLA